MGLHWGWWFLRESSETPQWEGKTQTPGVGRAGMRKDPTEGPLEVCVQELGLNWGFRRRQELLLGGSHSPMPPEASPVVNEFLRVRTTLSSLIQQHMPREGPLYVCRENEQNNSWLTLKSHLPLSLASSTAPPFSWCSVCVWQLFVPPINPVLYSVRTI